MKLVEKIIDGIGVFSPIIILMLACISYLSYPEIENSYPEQKMKKEINQADKKPETISASQPFLLYKDYPAKSLSPLM